ncbi:DNA alkylation repair protein [Paenibacillus sp. GYB003]|uniref:DNA alkylation repair protein n=1 Tax=Paenibacillus sp. GYB003 TaxID=2994392 RepID=UPI002F961B58
MTTLREVMDKLEAMGSEQTKSTFLRHGAKEPLFGVKVGDLKKLVKEVKANQQVARALYDTGNSDAMYLAGLTVDPRTADKDMLQRWVRAANWYMLAEYAVAWVAAESPHALELAEDWIRSPDEMTAVCGWSTYANYISITPDGRLDLRRIERLLGQIEATVHEERNRVRYAMNGFVIAVGVYAAPLHEKAKACADAIGSVKVDVGQTACKVPRASEYIRKAEERGKVGVKRKTCIC